MEYMDLLGVLNGENSLDAFAKDFFLVIAASQIEERESSNYVDGRYFRGGVENVSFTVSWADFEGNEDLPFWVQIKTDELDSETLQLMIEKMIHSKAMPAGFQFARMLNFGMREECRFDYE